MFLASLGPAPPLGLMRLARMDVPAPSVLFPVTLPPPIMPAALRSLTCCAPIITIAQQHSLFLMTTRTTASHLDIFTLCKYSFLFFCYRTLDFAKHHTVHESTNWIFSFFIFRYHQPRYTRTYETYRIKSNSLCFLASFYASAEQQTIHFFPPPIKRIKGIFQILLSQFAWSYRNSPINANKINQTNSLVYVVCNESTI